MCAMNFGQQSSALVSTVSIINSLDEATREKVLAELPEELKRRLIAEQHAANILAAAGLNVHPNAAQQLLASGFLNLASPEIIVGHQINFVKTPVAGLSHTVLRTPTIGSSHNSSIKTPRASNYHGTPMAHHVNHVATRLTGAGISDSGFKPTTMNHLEAGFKPASMNHMEARPGVGNRNFGMRIAESSPSQIMNSRSLGTGIAFSARGSGASTSQNYNPRANMAHDAGFMNAERLGVPSPANIQMNHSHGHAVHIASAQRLPSLPGSTAQRLPSLPGSSSSGMNGHFVRHKPMTSIYFDDFKLGYPSKGLSVVSNRWWGSAEPDKVPDETRSLGVSSATDPWTDSPSCAENKVESCAPHPNNLHIKLKGPKEIVQFCSKVTRSRSRAAVCGKRALKLGLTKGYGVHKLRDKDADILRFIFGGSFPREWSPALPASAC